MTDIVTELRIASALILAIKKKSDDWEDMGPVPGEKKKRRWVNKVTGEERIQIIHPGTPSVKDLMDKGMKRDPIDDMTISSILGPDYEPNMSGAARLAASKAYKDAHEMLSKAKSAGEDHFFSNVWPAVCDKAGLNARLSSPEEFNATVLAAAKDLTKWLNENPKYTDYYHKDWEVTRSILDKVYPDFSDDDFAGFRLFTGFTSPNTRLDANMKDAISLMTLWKKEKSFNVLKLKVSELTGRRQTEEGAPFKMGGAAQANKIYNMHILEGLYRDKGSWQKVTDYLKEGDTVDNLNVFRKKCGYKDKLVDVEGLKQKTRDATGQSKLIPRMMMFGPKVGAYTLNTTGDDRFTTADVWESRFIRSLFPYLRKGSGLPQNSKEISTFSKFSKKFNKVMSEINGGREFSPSSLQAARWFYMIEKAREAGYKYAKSDGTISEYTEKAIRGK